MTRGIDVGDETVASKPSATETTILPSTTTWRYRRRHFTNWIIAGALFGTMLTAIPYTLKYIPDRVDGRRMVWTHWDSDFVATLGLAPGIAVGLTAATITLVLRSRTAVSRRSDFAGIGAATACYYATLIVMVVAQFYDGVGRVGVKYYSVPLVSALVFAGVGALVWRSLRPPHSAFGGDSPFGLAGDATGEVGDHQLEEGP